MKANGFEWPKDIKSNLYKPLYKDGWNDRGEADNKAFEEWKETNRQEMIDMQTGLRNEVIVIKGVEDESK